jgi:alkanesulfonate monooxygenase SsuD/methylene tetrahydromethanopterin reductase-like flavin-dependent oxidoreductase (luciferase family)
MLAVTGRSSDGWVTPLSTYTPPSAVPAMQERIDEAARSAGRDPADVRRIYNVVGSIGAGRGGPGLTGDVENWVDTLTDWSIDLGLDTFIVWPRTAPLAQLELFADQVVPAVRQRVSERRGLPLGDHVPSARG